MSRYIDADALIKDIEDCSYETWSKGVNRAWWAQAVTVKDNINACIERQPTADVVEVVRCRDCLFARVEDGKIKCYNTYGLLVTKETEYCSRGRRRANDET